MNSKLILKMAGLFLSLSTMVYADVYSSETSNRRSIDLDDFMTLRTYASTNNYYFGVQLKAGMRVSYSASYGIGKEAGQAYGTIVEKDGRFLFKQDGMRSGQLLLPPGLPLESRSGVSMWDIGAYLDLVNRVVFSAQNTSYQTENPIYDKPVASLVDFEGGTAGKRVQYNDALEVAFRKQLGDRADSVLSVYYARGVGPVIIEFKENLMPGGTFKFYLGE